MPDTDGARTARYFCAQLQAGVAPMPWVYLYDEPGGTYKSTLLALTLRHWIVNGGGGLIVGWKDFLRDIRSTYDHDAMESEAAMLEQIIEAPALVLDDVGVGDLTQFDAEMFYAVLQRRLERDLEAGGKRWMGMTSNYSVAELVQRYAAAPEDKRSNGRLRDPRMRTRIERRLVDATAEVHMLG